jgi:hydrophobic/amphiphilic exporter-1 (mainly G- bacteria), HAE1 family
MNLSELFIRRPVMTTLVMIGILIFGLMSYVLLPISALPNVEYPFISVFANLPGATPETMASSVAAPLERQFTEIAGLNSFNSTSSTGSTNISLQFDFSRRVEDAAKDVQAAISAAAGQLPAGMPHPPTYRKVNPSVSPPCCAVAFWVHINKDQIGSIESQKEHLIYYCKDMIGRSNPF